METTVDRIVPPAPVQISFPGTQLTATGTVVHVEQDGLLIQLDSPLQALIGESPAGGTPVWVGFMISGQIGRASATILSENGPFLTLFVNSEAQQAERRDLHRLPCNLPVMYRAQRTDRVHHVWHEALALDVTLAGLRLWVPSSVTFPEKIELQLCLPAEMYRAGTGTVGVRKSDAADVIKATGVARHGRFMHDGGTLIGVHLDLMSQAAQLKFECYLKWLVTGRYSQAA